MGCLLARGRDKWWAIAATVLALLLAWGRHFMPFTELFFTYLPGYDKFRTVSMILVIAQWTVPLLGPWGSCICGGTARRTGRGSVGRWRGRWVSWAGSACSSPWRAP